METGRAADRARSSPRDYSESEAWIIHCPKPRNSALSVCGYEAADGAPVADRKGKTSIILLAPIGQCFDEIARHAEALGRQLSASWSRQPPVSALEIARAARGERVGQFV